LWDANPRMDKKHGRREFIRSLYLVGEHVLSLYTCVDAREEGTRVCERQNLEKT
jgi:hypothetical protein